MSESHFFTDKRSSCKISIFWEKISILPGKKKKNPQHYFPAEKIKQNILFWAWLKLILFGLSSLPEVLIFSSTLLWTASTCSGHCSLISPGADASCPRPPFGTAPWWGAVLSLWGFLAEPPHRITSLHDKERSLLGNPAQRGEQGCEGTRFPWQAISGKPACERDHRMLPWELHRKIHLQ